jgi:predicted DNA-binding transcriptional regulator AlpA
MGPAEIGRRLGGIGRARVYQITQRRNFPEPIAQLEMGNVWLAEDVEAWVREHRPEIAEGPEGE